MATHTHNYGRASALPLPAVLASIPSYPRPVIERLVSRLIETLDLQDGDPDFECDPFNEGEPAFDERSRAMANAHPNCCPDGDMYQPQIGGLGWVYAHDCEDAEEGDPAEDGHDAEIETWSNPEDCPTEAFIGRRTPARQLGAE